MTMPPPLQNPVAIPQRLARPPAAGNVPAMFLGVAPRLLEKKRRIVRPRDAICPQKCKVRLAIRSAHRHSKQCFSICRLQRSIFPRKRLNFFSVEPPFYDGKRQRTLRLRLPLNCQRHAIQIALVIESSGLQKLCVVAVDGWLGRPPGQLREKRRRAQLRHIHINHRARIFGHERQHRFTVA